jgi:hypothetical protein
MDGDGQHDRPASRNYCRRFWSAYFISVLAAGTIHASPAGGCRSSAGLSPGSSTRHYRSTSGFQASTAASSLFTTGVFPDYPDAVL